MIVAPKPQSIDPATPFTLDGRPTGDTVAGFWAWAYSGLIDNKNRGVLAEFIVAKSLGIVTAAHDPWGSHDLISDSRIAIEVKATGYLQAWNQRDLSRPAWTSLRSRRSETTSEGGWSLANTRTAKGEVFALCLFTATDHASANPLNLDQWAFWLLPGADITSDSLGLAVVEKKHRRLTFIEMCPAFEALERQLRA